jgi:hypothetical protein
VTDSPSKKPSRESYSDLLAANEVGLPLTTAYLRLAELHRLDRLRLYKDGMRLAAFEQLLRILHNVDEALHAKPDLLSVRYLVLRVRDDFVSALEATLSGYHGNVADAMRDVSRAPAFSRSVRWCGSAR